MMMLMMTTIMTMVFPCRSTARICLCRFDPPPASPYFTLNMRNLISTLHICTWYGCSLSYLYICILLNLYICILTPRIRDSYCSVFCESFWIFGRWWSSLGGSHGLSAEVRKTKPNRPKLISGPKGPIV